MLIAIERYQFNYLFKFDSVAADLNRILWLTKEDLLKEQVSNPEKAAVLLGGIFPPFEEDHELVLLEYDRRSWEVADYKYLEFAGVLSLIPLTRVGRRLLIGKLNEKLQISEPFFEKTVESIKRKKGMQFQRLAATKLLQLFHLNEPPAPTVELIEKAINGITGQVTSSSDKGNIFHALFAYNTTEGFIPEGNLEYLCKLAVLARLHLGQDSSLVQQGPFYKELLQHGSFLNEKGLIEAFQEFISKSESSTATQRIKEVVNDGLAYDMLFVAYLFFAFRRTLNNTDHDVYNIKADIEKVSSLDPIVASIITYAIGMVFSFEQLYESIHILSNAPLVAKSTRPMREDREKVLPKMEESVSPPRLEESSQSVSDAKKESHDLSSAETVHAQNSDGAADEYKIPSVEIVLENEDATKEKQTQHITAPNSTNEDSNRDMIGIPLIMFKEFVQKQIPKSQVKDILMIIDHHMAELRQGITFKWLNDKLFLEDTSGKKSKISDKSIKAIKAFFQDNKVISYH